MIRVLIVDDHMIIRRGLRQILAEDARIGDLHEAADGLDVLANVRHEFPKTGVLMLSVYPESQFALRAIRSGANGYLNKSCAPDTLMAAICRAAEGGTYVTPEIADLMAQDIRREHGQAPHETLSNREFQVLQLLAQGQTIGNIAQQLSLSANTISTYRARICDKLGLRNALEIAHYAARHQLLGT
jgi:DNA-binding NarL/FixJ family response regulator